MELAGEVIAFFAKPSAAVIRLSLPLNTGDVIYIKGFTSDFQQAVESMQVGRQAVSAAEAGQEIGLRVAQKCRKHDAVYKLVTAPAGS